ncbi:AraC family transcriptional regulator [Aquimarina sp. 2201CG5-10]|uniref:helix-turn-helix domain-containing protein n=1 Tax=Aquimarina callyspongiae TaxID=3098150 RepID=UPI002AB56C82|nr:AraC family transcriptional regulator [Aquimarina sp. 2201CG5-10]MDY8137895.1 AraC family transcriptional regulator [Aquimarina sp. 2201CG5-10]
MPTDNIPELYIHDLKSKPELFVYDFRMTEDAIKTKVNLSMHMFSFLQTGKKQVHFAETSVLVDSDQSLLIKKGNCLWSELLDKEDIYYCKLFFFSEKRLKEFLSKYVKRKEQPQETPSYFTIGNDSYLTSYLNSLSKIASAPPAFMDNLLSVKFEELLVYLLNKYKTVFENYLLSLITQEGSSFKKSIEQNVYSTLTLEEIAFLCNMSLSTFKRHFIKEYNVSPGKWLRDKRLLKAKELLEEGNLKSSDIYLDLGYNNLSNFSSAFKTRFGVNPSEV